MPTTARRLFTRLLERLATLGPNGIPVFVLTPDDGDKDRNMVEDALSLIAKTRPEQRARLRRLVKLIVVVPDRRFVARWQGGVGHVDVSSYWMHQWAGRYFVDPVSAVAANLVHEGTHARLSELGISGWRDEGKRWREEQVCGRSELVLLRRVPGSASLQAIVRARMARKSGLSNVDQARALVEDGGVPRWLRVGVFRLKQAKLRTLIAVGARSRRRARERQLAYVAEVLRPRRD